MLYYGKEETGGGELDEKLGEDLPDAARELPFVYLITTDTFHLECLGNRCTVFLSFGNLDSMRHSILNDCQELHRQWSVMKLTYPDLLPGKVLA